MNIALKIALHALLVCLLAAANIIVYMKSYSAHAKPWLSEPNFIDSFFSNAEATFYAYGVLALLTLLITHFANSRAWPIKPIWVNTAIVALATVANFGLYVASFVDGTQYVLSETQLDQSLVMMLSTSLPAFLGVASLFGFFIYCFKHRDNHK